MELNLWLKRSSVHIGFPALHIDEACPPSLAEWRLTYLTLAKCQAAASQLQQEVPYVHL